MGDVPNLCVRSSGLAHFAHLIWPTWALEPPWNLLLGANGGTAMLPPKMIDLSVLTPRVAPSEKGKSNMETSAKLPSFDWVTETFRHSAESVFNQLRTEVMLDVEKSQELNQGSGKLNCSFRFRGIENDNSFIAYMESPTPTALVRFTLENNELIIRKKEVGGDKPEKDWLKIRPVLDPDGTRTLFVAPAEEGSSDEPMAMAFWQFRRMALGWLLFPKANLW